MSDVAAIAQAARAWLAWHEENGTEGLPTPRIAKASTLAPTPASSLTRSSTASTIASESPSFDTVPAPRSAAAPAPPPPPRVVIPARPLEVVQAEVQSCVKCVLASTRTSTVFSRGNPAARVAFVGEAPGAEEDAQGIPFVGKAGQLLDKMIGAMGLSPESDVYVCNIIKCRPPGNRRPEPEEIATCIPYLHEQLANVTPEVIVAMGNTAVQALLDTTLGITKMRGAWKLYRGNVPVMPTYHPSYLLRPGPTQQEAKRHAWEDLQQVMKKLGLAVPKK